jgi:hypothetical protein
MTNYLEHYIRFLLRFRVFLRPCFAYPTRTGRKGDTRLPVSISLRNFALLSSQCFESSYVIKRAFRVRLFQQPFFAGLARLGSLGKTGRSVYTATNGVLQKVLRTSASCSCFSAAANTALLRLQC